MRVHARVSECDCIHSQNPVTQWIDTVEVDCSVSAEDPELVTCDSRARSTGVVPASVPCACPVSVLLCAVCFLDMGKNLEHLNILKSELAKAGIVVGLVQLVRRVRRDSPSISRNELPVSLNFPLPRSRACPFSPADRPKEVPRAVGRLCRRKKRFIRESSALRCRRRNNGPVTPLR